MGFGGSVTFFLLTVMSSLSNRTLSYDAKTIYLPVYVFIDMYMHVWWCKLQSENSRGPEVFFFAISGSDTQTTGCQFPMQTPVSFCSFTQWLSLIVVSSHYYQGHILHPSQHGPQSFPMKNIFVVALTMSSSVLGVLTLGNSCEAIQFVVH